MKKTIECWVLVEEDGTISDCDEHDGPLVVRHIEDAEGLAMMGERACKATLIVEVPDAEEK